MYSYSSYSNYSSFTIGLSLIFAVYLIAVMWKIINKAGDKGWKALIPFYGSYVFCKAVDSAGLWVATIVLSVLYLLISAIGGSEVVILVFAIIYLIAMLVISIMMCKNVSTCFGKSGGFTVGLFFLFPIFIGILAFGSARHYNQLPASTESYYGSKSFNGMN